MTTFRPPETTPRFTQEGFSTGVVDRLILSPRRRPESTVAVRTFEVDVKSVDELPMVYAPEGQSGQFFNRQTRKVLSLQVVEALAILEDRALGPACLQGGRRSSAVALRRPDVQPRRRGRRADGSLAERITFGPRETAPEVAATEFALFVQDRWRVNGRLSVELGLRFDRAGLRTRQLFSARRTGRESAAEGRGILRGGVGTFAERTPLTVGAFTQYDPQTISRFAADGTPMGGPVTYAHAIDGALEDT